MRKLIKIVKINIKSLIALPLLLLASVFKMTAKAMEKILLILSALFTTGVVMLGFEIVKNPKSFGPALLALVLLLLFGGLFVALLIYAGTAIFAAYNFIVRMFNVFYELAYTGFLRLFESSMEDYQFISLNGRKVLNGFLCPFYSLLRAAEWCIATLMSLALWLASGLSILLIIATLSDVNRTARALFGLSLWQYIGRFNTFNIVYGVCMYVVIIGSIILIIMSLGVEWNEWGRELRMNVSDYAEAIDKLKQREVRMTNGSQTLEDPGTIYLQNLTAHMEGLDGLESEVAELLDKKDNALLRNSFGGYLKTLSSIVEECASYRDGIPYEKFQKLIPRIQQLEKQRSDVREMIEKQRKILQNPSGASVFFSGCNSPEKLEKRYKSLCKAYHPDADGGDESTFKKMQEEYERLKAALATQPEVPAERSEDK